MPELVNTHCIKSPRRRPRRGGLSRCTANRQSAQARQSWCRVLAEDTGVFPGHSIHIDAIFASGDHVIGERTIQTTLAEPLYGGLTWKVPISLHGASIVGIENGKITDWMDYYDGLTSRRTALASYFTE
jgi:hypothetical protein